MSYVSRCQKEQRTSSTLAKFLEISFCEEVAKIRQKKVKIRGKTSATLKREHIDRLLVGGGRGGECFFVILYLNCSWIFLGCTADGEQCEATAHRCKLMVIFLSLLVLFGLFLEWKLASISRLFFYLLGLMVDVILAGEWFSTPVYETWYSEMCYCIFKIVWGMLYISRKLKYPSE